MPFNKISIVLILFLSFLNACSLNLKKDEELDKTSVNSCKHSRWLKIYENEEKITIKITNPDNPKQVFVFEGSPKINQKKTNSIKYLVLPIEKMAVLSSTHIGMLAKLKAINTISAISNVKFVFNPKIQRGVKNGQIISLGDEGQISIDKLLKSKAKAMVYSAFSGDFSQEKKFEKLGITSIPNFDWRETTPLGKADWLLLFGYLTGKQKEAKEEIKKLNAIYLKSVLSAQKNKSTDIFLLGNQMGDYWYAPAGESYQALLLEDAGINYLYADTKGTGSLALPMEQVIKDSKKATIWLNPGFKTKKEIITSNPKAAFLSVFQKGKIYCYSANMNKFWENSTVQPHLLLNDLQVIKSTKAANDNLHFYRLVE